MLVTLKRNSTVLGSTLSAQGSFCQTIVKILTGVWTQPSHLSGLSLWDTANCLFEAGTDTTENWSVVASVDTGVGVAGWYLLSKASPSTTKPNYLYIAWGQSNNTLFGTALGYASGSIVGLQTVNNGAYSTVADTSGQTFFLRFAENYVHFFSQGNGFTNSTLSTPMDLVWFDFNKNVYDEYSSEGSLKFMYGNTNLLVNNMFLVHYDICTQAVTLTSPTNITTARMATVGTSRSPNMGSTTNLMIPFMFSDYTRGWMGGNASSSMGMYVTTAGYASNGTKVTVGSDAYMIRSWPSSAGTFLCSY